MKISKLFKVIYIYIKFSKNLSFLQENIKHVISRKLQGFEKSYSEARLATHVITLTFTKSRLIFQNFCTSKFLKYYKDLRTEIWRQDSQPLRVPWQHPTTVMKISNFVKFSKFKVSGDIEKSRKLPYFVITRPNCALDRRTILCLYVPGFQRQVFKQVKILSERSKGNKEQKRNKGSVLVEESAYNAQFGLVMVY